MDKTASDNLETDLISLEVVGIYRLRINNYSKII